MKILSSWSGGKDSCYALMLSKDQGNHISGLLNMMNEGGEISKSHGIPLSLLKLQAKAIGVPIHTEAVSWGNYEENYLKCLAELKEGLGIEGVVFGDVDIESHRDWEEMVCEKSDLIPQLPLWQKDRRELVFKMIDSGIKAIIVSCNLEMGEHFLGREITKNIVQELESLGVDACGENGEYHTLVIDCPLFESPINLPNYATMQHDNYCFIKWS